MKKHGNSKALLGKRNAAKNNSKDNSYRLRLSSELKTKATRFAEQHNYKSLAELMIEALEKFIK